MKTETRRMIIDVHNVPEDLPLDKFPTDGTHGIDLVAAESPKNGMAVLNKNLCEDCPDKECRESHNALNPIRRLTDGLDSNVAEGAEFIFNHIDPEDRPQFLMVNDMNRVVAKGVAESIAEGDVHYAMNNLLSYVSQLVFNTNQSTKNKLYSVIGPDK